MSRNYQILVDAEQAERAGTPPPVAPVATLIRHKWSFDESDFGRIPELRAWLANEHIEDFEERGLAGGPGLAPDDTLVNFSTTATVRDVVREANLVERRACPACGLSEVRVVDDPTVTLRAEPRAGALLTHVAELEAFAIPAAAADELRAAGLARGLRVVPVEAPGEPHVIVCSDVAVGEPVAPFGTTGERCPACGRAYRRAPDGHPHPALPRYAMYLIFERASGDPQWVWSTTGGPLWPMVTHDVARWLHDRDPQMTSLKRGWSPDELDAAFLEDEYR
jgi:hypothetical protein